MKKILIAGIVLGLALFMNGCMTDDSIEIWNISLGIQLTNVDIDSYGTHYYAFIADTDDVYDIELTGLGSNLDWELFPYVSDSSSDYRYGDGITSGDTYSEGNSSDEIVSGIPLTPGTYIIKVDEWDRMDSYYSLYVDHTP